MAETPRQSRAPPAFVLPFDSRRIHDGFIVPHCFLRVKRAARAVPRRTTFFTARYWFGRFSRPRIERIFGIGPAARRIWQYRTPGL